MYACLAVTCHLHFWQNDRDFLRATAVTRGWNGYRNKSQHRKSTLEKKILPPFQQGFEPATFQLRVQSLWTSISLMQARVFCFFAGGSSILNSNRHMWQWKEEAMLCKIQMHDFRSHFWWYYLAYCIRPVNVYLAMACVCCLFTSFSVFLLCVKQQQNLMKIMFSCIHFLVWPYLPQIMKKMYFIQHNTGKLYRLTGMLSVLSTSPCFFFFLPFF